MTDERPSEDGFPKHIADALGHARKTLECYLALASVKAKALMRSAMKVALLAVVVIAAAVLGLFFFLLGLAGLLESIFDLPRGMGLLIVGVALLLITGIGLLMLRGRRER